MRSFIKKNGELSKEMGRPLKEIDWNKVEQLCIAGCPATEIAPHFDIHPDTLYIRIKEKYNMTYTDFSAKFRQKGDSLLRNKQFEKALKGDGDNTQLIWLGKQRLGQKETPQETGVSEETLSQFAALMKQLTEAQNARKIAETSNREESKS